MTRTITADRETHPSEGEDAARVGEACAKYTASVSGCPHPFEYKQTEVGFIPKDWEVKPMREIGSLSKGKGLLKEDIRLSGAVPAVPYTALYTDFSEVLDYGRIKWFVDDTEGTVVIDEPCVLIASSSNMAENTGKASAPPGHVPIAVGREVIIFRTGNSATFISYLLSTASYRKRTLALARGTTIKHLYPATFADYKLCLPSPSEQRAIAEALSDVDGLLSALDALIAKNRAIKQAAMQQFLTGKTRLPGFSGSWGASCVGAEFHVQLGKMLDAAKNSGQLKPYLGNRSVQWGRIDLSELAEARLTDTDVKRLRLRKGDLLVCEGGEVGRAAIWNDELSECYYQKALHRLRPRGSFDPYLMQLLLEFWASTGGFDAFVTKTSIAHLPKDKLEIIPLPVPPVEEQSAIVSMLAEFESEIAALERRREKTRAIKQGMMQQLLTGRVRLLSPSAATSEGAIA